KTLVWVAEAHGMMTGFIAYTLNSMENGQENTGEVELLAVHPDYQNHGIGTELNQFALEKMKESGMKLAIVATGGDPGHAPARRKDRMRSSLAWSRSASSSARCWRLRFLPPPSRALAHFSSGWAFCSSTRGSRCVSTPSTCSAPPSRRRWPSPPNRP